CLLGSMAIARARFAVTVLLPTPPLPERISTLCLTFFKRSLINAKSSSGFLSSPDAQIA
uniref:Uncharacterized protein n=1 Tax=Parascaris univalens TaxID=6257 RepID=A0A915CBY7_PARUN